MYTILTDALERISRNRLAGRITAEAERAQLDGVLVVAEQMAMYGWLTDDDVSALRHHASLWTACVIRGMIEI